MAKKLKIEEAIDFFVWLKDNRSWILEVGLDDKLYMDLEDGSHYNSWTDGKINKSVQIKKMTDKEFREKLFNLFKEYFKDELSLEAL